MALPEPAGTALQNAMKMARVAIQLDTDCRLKVQLGPRRLWGHRRVAASAGPAGSCNGTGIPVRGGMERGREEGRDGRDGRDKRGVRGVDR